MIPPGLQHAGWICGLCGAHRRELGAGCANPRCVPEGPVLPVVRPLGVPLDFLWSGEPERYQRPRFDLDSP